MLLGISEGVSLSNLHVDQRVWVWKKQLLKSLRASVVGPPGVRVGVRQQKLLLKGGDGSGLSRWLLNSRKVPESPGEHLPTLSIQNSHKRPFSSISWDLGAQLGLKGF